MVPAFPNEGMLPLSCARSAGEIHGQWRLTADLEGFVGREDIKIVLSLTERTLGGEAGWREARVDWTKNERSIALVVVARQDLSPATPEPTQATRATTWCSHSVASLVQSGRCWCDAP